MHDIGFNVMSDYDVVIVGAGPAGSTTARRAAQAGLNVVLVDKAKFPRDKPCAGGVRHFVTELLDFDPKETLHRRISGLALFSPSGFRVDCVPQDRSKPGYTVMREEFDNLLFQKAVEAGAETKEETSIVKVEQQKERVVATTSENETMSAKFVVGADGINSVVAKELGFYRGWEGKTAGVAIEMEAEVGSNKVKEICGEVSGYDAELLLLWFGDLPNGYIWCFPKKSVLSLGAWCRQDIARDVRGTFNKWFAKFKEQYSIDPNIVSDSSARFPIVPAKEIVKGRALLVGDAAGLVDAFTGEGIPYAIHSGIVAASVLKDAVRNPQLLRNYRDQCRKSIINDLMVSSSMASLFYKRTKSMETLCRFFRDDSYANFLIAALIGGLLAPKTVKSKLTRRIVRKRPRAALSLLV
jgi:geranylgeranyl reductase family protein